MGGKGGGQHAGKELERHRQQELHEGNDDKGQEGDEAEEVADGPGQLARLASGHRVSVQDLPCDLGRHLVEEKNEFKTSIF